jgi:N-acylglucosamine-6-phosphate 2-epimerase
VGLSSALGELRGGLVVSVQAPAGSPLAEPVHMVAMARAAEAGGAVGIRAEGVADVKAFRAAVDVPIIGLCKRRVPGSDVYLTPAIEDALSVASAGADLVAVDATARLRPDGRDGTEFVAALSAELPGRVLADVDRATAGVAARAAGAAAVATTLAGYVDSVHPPAEPDIALVGLLADELDCPVLAEGRYASAAQVAEALAAGAHAVVVGTAITDPVALTRTLAAATPRGADGPAR